MKFNDEELSRIMSAHANDQLRVRGYDNKVCLLGAAIEDKGYTQDEECKWSWYAWEKRIGSGVKMWNIVNHFDANYNPGWPLGKFLRELEKQGLA